jgi:hypothetical protein
MPPEDESKSHDEHKMLLGVPWDVWKSALIALAFGCVFLVPLWIYKYFHPYEEPPLWEHIVRDVGIAFLVAGIVSFIYEWSTRVTAERHKIEGILRTFASAFVPETVWDEVNKEILHRMVVRRKLEIELKLYAKDEEVDGKIFSLPGSQSVLWVQTKYELYSLAVGNPKLRVTHYLDEHMRDQGGKEDLPRFLSVEVAEAGESSVTHPLDTVFNPNEGCIQLDGETGVKLPHPSENRPVCITIQRYEIINTPGIYMTVLPEIVIPPPKETLDGLARRMKKSSRQVIAPPEGPKAPTISVTISKPLPVGIKANVHTWFETDTRRFVRDGDDNSWTFDGVMLAGQGFSVVFSKENLPAPETMQQPENIVEAEGPQPVESADEQQVAQEEAVSETTTLTVALGSDANEESRTLETSDETPSE